MLGRLVAQILGKCQALVERIAQPSRGAGFRFVGDEQT